MANLEEIAEKWLQAFNRHDADAVMAFYAPNCVVAQPHLPEPLRGKEANKKDLQTFLTAFPDIRMEFLGKFVKGDTLACEWQWKGTHKGPLPGPTGTIEATNRPVQIKGAEFVRINAQGLIEEERGYWDLVAMMGQLGLGFEGTTEPASRPAAGRATR